MQGTIRDTKSTHSNTTVLTVIDKMNTKIIVGKVRRNSNIYVATKYLPPR